MYELVSRLKPVIIGYPTRLQTEVCTEALNASDDLIRLSFIDLIHDYNLNICMMICVYVFKRQ